jgi:putative component of membrane protein insertase Oxa1/YidC/SpoIIIJ protein YidD
MKKLFAFCLVVLSFHTAFAQLSGADDSLIAATTFYHPGDFSYYHGAGNSSGMMQTRKHGGLEAYNPVALLLKGSMWTYQHVISPQLSSPCPYQISCSNFAKACISEYGILKGTALAADRLMRCNRISLMDIPPIDFDPHTHHILDDPDWYKRHR